MPLGVRSRDGRFYATITVLGRQIALGAYPTAKEAAIARDRAALFVGLDVRLNEPEQARRLGPCSPIELRNQAALAGRKRRKQTAIGVVRNPSGGWDARIILSGKTHYIGNYDTERDAARAYDRAVLYHVGAEAPRNFRDEALEAASIDAIRAEAGLGPVRTLTSAFRGVRQVERPQGRAWLAMLGQVSLGAWPTEEAAALAHDRAALGRPGFRTKINFPDAARMLGAASPAELRALAHAYAKAGKSSRYRGVSFNPQAKRWQAAIWHAGKTLNLGLFDDERQAAERYDEEARRLRGGRAVLNFPP